MSSGVYRLRKAKGTYPIGANPRRFDNKDTMTPSSIRPGHYENKTVVQDEGLAPKKVMPQTISKWTPPPHSYAHDAKPEGKVRGRQADKSSKSK